MSRGSARLRAGDLVEVKTPDEIVATLDVEGASDHLPFMPEMLDYCGRRFRVSRRASTICFSGPGWARGFRTDDVVTLESVRCSGSAHDGCQKQCVIFWREAWLRRVEGAPIVLKANSKNLAEILNRLKISTDPNTYFCQASELSKATDVLSRRQRLKSYLGRLGTGDLNIVQVLKSFRTYVVGKIRRIVAGRHPPGRSESSDTEQSLNLQLGEWVEVKPLRSIMQTLDERGKNRGLYFSPDMHLWCGQRRRVKGRLERIIVDGTGQMRKLRNTVSLEGSTCGCDYMGFDMGACARCELTYWREIWLRRIGPES
jgi:hypothetical protein